MPPPANGKERLKATTRHVYRAALKENPEAVFHFHDPELLPFMVLLKLRGRRVIYDAHEDTPRQVFHQYWIPPILRWPVSISMRLLEAIGSRLFDGIIAVNDTIARRFPKRKTLIIPNYPFSTQPQSIQVASYRERPMQAAYVGGLTEVRGIREMIEAIHRLSSELSAKLVLAGTFYPAELEKEMREQAGWDRVDFRGWVTQSELSDILNFTRVGLVVLHPTAQYRDSFPTKMFEYMAAGLPVVASNFPRLKNFIDRHRCGLTVDPHDTKAVADAIEYLFTHPEEAEAMGRRGREAIEENFNWEKQAEKLVAMYESLVT